MAKFLFVYRGGQEFEDMSPEQVQKTMQLWMDWIEVGMKEGWMVAPGDALSPDGKVVHPDKSVTDGPFAESKELVGGYSIVQAETLLAACDIAKTCPIIVSEGNVEVRELMNVAEE